MKRNLVEALGQWIAEGSRPFCQMGQIAIQPVDSGFELSHVDDREKATENLELHQNPTDARLLATYDDEGGFRPLKTAPNLRHGWKLRVSSLENLRTALEGFYPAMLGSLLSLRRNELEPVHLRETLGRQTGMYAITKKLTDEQAQSLVGTVCNSASGCLKTILWRIDPDQPIHSLPASKFDPGAPQFPGAGIPMPCAEACNILVAAARETVKKSPPPAE